MQNDEETLDAFRPAGKPKVIDLVEQAGLDVTDWANYKGGIKKAGANPKYCYEWCFEQEGMFVLNIWHENLRLEAGSVLQRLNLRQHAPDAIGIHKLRANRFENVIKLAYESGSNPRVILLDRAKVNEGSATARALDHAPWTVTKYDYATGDFEIRRGITSTHVEIGGDPEIESFLEGEARYSFVTHRKREAKLRQKKLEQHKLKNSGRLPCEVPGCAFDFAEKYGELGQDYAHVHHLVPLSQVLSGPVHNTIEDVAVVCANCHAMIHKGGQCRELNDLVRGVKFDVQ